ncbi:hypothetical protein ABG067_004036 [Albugo candida]|uniref:Uncharacterized protein n=1 Tax=Albugo candida TaxID=65357 RepID=A0A024FUM3_9STRA|nr:unnamed protein product [Albugo candida]|eukprot:CCI10741.1 unnamed protein product [Albugo candida]
MMIHRGKPFQKNGWGYSISSQVILRFALIVRDKLMHLSKWKLVACVHIIALRRVKSPVFSEDTEFSERKAKRTLAWVEGVKNALKIGMQISDMYIRIFARANRWSHHIWSFAHY